MAKITAQALSTKNSVLGPTARFSIGDNPIAEVELLSVDTGSIEILQLSERGLERFTGRPTHELFTHIRHTSTYAGEWDLLEYFHEESPGDLKMTRIALSAQFAVEACAVYPFLESDARRWLREKFRRLHVPGFETAWQDYLSMKNEVMLGHRRIY